MIFYTDYETNKKLIENDLFLLFYEEMRDFLSDLSPSNFETARYKNLTLKDIIHICCLKSSSDYTFNNYDGILKKALTSCGKHYNGTLYRGCSKNETDNIINSNTTILKHWSSFSEDIGIAQLFNENIMTLQSCSINLFPIDYFCSGFQAAVNYFDVYNLINYYGLEISDFGNIDSSNVFDFLYEPFKVIFSNNQYLDESPCDDFDSLDDWEEYDYSEDSIYLISNRMSETEYEWLIPRHVKFITVDKNKLVFKL